MAQSVAPGSLMAELFFAEQTLAPGTLPPVRSFPEVITTDQGVVWLAPTLDFLRAINQNPSRCFLDRSVDVTESVTVLARNEHFWPITQNRLYMFVAGDIDHARDVLATFLFGHCPFFSMSHLATDLRPVYMAHGYEMHRLTHCSLLTYPAFRRPTLRRARATPLAFRVEVKLLRGQILRASSDDLVGNAPCPLVFHINHEHMCVWVSQKTDNLLRVTLTKQWGVVSEVSKMIASFVPKYMVVVLTRSPRIEFADIFIVGNKQEYMAILGAIMYKETPYVDDVGYLMNVARHVGSLLRCNEFGNYRIFQLLRV